MRGVEWDRNALHRLDPARTALVLFDVLTAYLHPADPVKAAVLAERQLLARLQALLEDCRRQGVWVCYTCAAHSPDGGDVVARLTDTDMDLRPWSDAPRPFRPEVHRGEPGAAIAEELTPRPGELVLPKYRWSAFYQTALELQLRARGLDTIILAGMSTDVGIASTAFSARDRDFGMVVARDACWSHRGPNHDFLMDRVFPRMARVRTVAEIRTMWKEEARR